MWSQNEHKKLYKYIYWFCLVNEIILIHLWKIAFFSIQFSFFSRANIKLGVSYYANEKQLLFLFFNASPVFDGMYFSAHKSVFNSLKNFRLWNKVNKLSELEIENIS